MQPGIDVVTVPYDVSQPVLSPGVVIEYQFTTKTVTVAPLRRGEPVYNVSHVFHVPKDVDAMVGALEEYYT